MALSQLSLTNTFFEWLNRCNEIITTLNGVESGSSNVANTTLVGSLFNLTSNTGAITIAGGSPDSGETVYLDVSLSSDEDNTSTTVATSANVVNTVHELSRSAFEQANSSNITAISAYDRANSSNIIAETTASAAFGKANTASSEAGGAHGTANNAYDAANVVSTTASSSYGQANTANTIAAAALPKSGGTMTGAYIDSQVALSDGASVALDASLGNIFTLSAAGDRTIQAPTNATAGQRIIIRHHASGANRTLSLTTGSAGAFRFGDDIPSLLITDSGTVDWIGAIYNDLDSRWDVIAYVQGY